MPRKKTRRKAIQAAKRAEEPKPKKRDHTQRRIMIDDGRLMGLAFAAEMARTVRQIK